jgi:hypothetical protein
LWDYLVEKGHVGEVEEDREPIEYPLDEARQVQAAARSATSPADGNDLVRQVAGAAPAARIDALSAIYAAWYYSCCFSVCDRAAAQRGA